MTKGELLKQLQGYSDDVILEVVQCGEHYDITCVVPYNDHGIQILELGIYKPKTIPESVKRANNVN